VTALQHGALEQWMEELAAHLQLGHDLLDQWLLGWRLLRTMAQSGALTVWPRSALAMPVPTRAMVQHALGLVWPAHRSVVLGLWSGDELWSGVALHRADGMIDRIAGPESWRRHRGTWHAPPVLEHATVTAAVERQLGPVALGIHAQTDTFRQLCDRVQGVSVAQALHAGTVIVQPGAAGLAAPLGVELARLAIHAARALMQRMPDRGPVPLTAGFEAPWDLQRWQQLGAWVTSARRLFERRPP